MGFFDNFKKKSKTEEIMSERARLKESISNKLKNIGFTPEEVEEVLSILIKCEEEVQKVKDEMIGTNINNDFAVEVTQEKLNEVRRLELKAGDDIKAKINEIRQRKKY